jgi:polysaccharide pyruvyl transferase WcaK-like protein
VIGLPSLQAIDRAQGARIWMAGEATDMRCGFDRLAKCVKTVIGRTRRAVICSCSVRASPLKHPLSKFFIPKALRAAEYVSFRDKPSQDLATEIGYTGKSYVCPDNVYSLQVLPPDPPARDSHPPVVGIAPMPFPFSDLLKCPHNADAIQMEFIDKIATFTSLVFNTNPRSYTEKCTTAPARRLSR